QEEMSLAVGEILQIVAVLQWLDGDIFQNVFNAVISGSGGPYDEADVVDDMEEWLDDMFANMVARTSDECDGSECRVYVYDPIDDDWDEVGTNAWVFNPTGSGDQLPRGVAGLINCKTTDPDVNGKKYMGGGGESATIDGVFQAAYLTDMALMAVDWLTPFVGSTSGADFTPGVWSPTRSNFYPMSGQSVIPSIPAYQRRRKQGVGI
ncbi:unnamed protein product, partial [marine sediment metagenome]